MFDERAQAEVWGANPQALIAAALAYPQGQGRRVDGGFIVNGRWNFSSSSDVAEWNMLAATVREGSKVVDHRTIFFTSCEGVRCHRVCKPGDVLSLSIKPKRLKSPLARPFAR